MLVKITPQKALDNLLSDIEVLAKTVDGTPITVHDIRSGVSYYQEVIDSVQTPNYGYESIIPEQKEEPVKNKPNPLIIRYVRPLARFDDQDNASFHNNGGITFGFKIDYVTKKLIFTFACCMLEDNFNKNLARKMIINRFNCNDFYVVDYDDTLSLINNTLLGERNITSPSGLTRLRTMMNMLISITQHNNSVL